VALLISTRAVTLFFASTFWAACTGVIPTPRIIAAPIINAKDIKQKFLSDAKFGFFNIIPPELQ
jgi:hypothetical protein